MNKASLRRQMRVRLYALSEDEICQKSLLIYESLISSISWNDITRVSCYRSQISLREVSTVKLIEYIGHNWPNIELDVIEPSKQAALPRTQYELIIVPILGFDSNYNRLGRGGGWYDRFLATQDSAYKVGLAFDCQLTDTIPIEDFDVELDEIITES